MSIQQINRTLGNIQNSLSKLTQPQKEENNVKEEITN